MADGKSKKERRRHKRAETPVLSLTIDGREYPATNLSMGGSMIEEYDGPLLAGSLLTITGIFDVDGNKTAVEIRSRVNRTESDAKRMAVTFLELAPVAYEIVLNAMRKKI
jgi:hypothetical protein